MNQPGIEKRGSAERAAESILWDATSYSEGRGEGGGLKRDLQALEILREMDREVGGGGTVFAGTISVAMLKADGSSPESLARKGEMDRNRRGVEEALFGGGGSVYSNAESVRHVTVLAADGSKAVTLAGQRIYAEGAGYMSTDIARFETSGGAGAKIRPFLGEAGEVGKSTVAMVDALVARRLESINTLGLSPDMTKEEVAAAVAKRDADLAEAKREFAPLLSSGGRLALEVGAGHAERLSNFLGSLRGRAADQAPDARPLPATRAAGSARGRDGRSAETK